MTAVKLVSVFSENKPGQTARVTQILADAGVNIRWVTIASMGAFGVMKFLVDKSAPAIAALKDKGLAVNFLDALAVEVQDKPGALHDVAKMLGQNGVNVDNVSGFVANQRAVLVLETQDLAKAQTVLESNGLRVLTQEEMQASDR
jgi:hypothetical protein